MRTWPWLTLLVLAPVLGEVVSGSTPPLRAINPGAAILLTVLYGGGALLAREYTRLWGKGWRTLLLLGVAYAILEEGLMCKSFFDPHWPDLGQLGVYGRWIGVNWVWTYFLTLYHALWSIGLSVLIAELLHPAEREKPWLKPWSRRLLIGLLALDVWVGYHALPGPGRVYHPAAWLYLSACAAMVLLIVAAYRAPAAEAVRPVLRLLPPWRFGLIAGLSAFAYFPLAFGAAATRLPPALYLMLVTLLVFWAGSALWRQSGAGRGWDDRHRAAVAAGALVPWVLWDFLLATVGNVGGKPMAGMSLVGIAMLALGWSLVWDARRRVETGPAGQAGAPERGDGAAATP